MAPMTRTLKVKKVYDNIIKDLSLDPKNVPLLAGEVVNADVGGAAAEANIEVDKLPTVIPNSYVISSSKLAAGGDHLHFTAESHKLFGQRYAATMLSILRKATAVRQGDRPLRGYALGAARFDGPAGKAEVDFALPERAAVSIRAYTLRGREIAELAGKEFTAGRHTVAFERSALPAGVCVVRMNAGAFSAARLMVRGD